MVMYVIMVFMIFRRKFSLLTSYLLSFNFIHPRRRAMVNKLWFREIIRKLFYSKSDPPNARVFSESRYQQKVNLWYLMYRWLIVGSWAFIVICSVFEIGSKKPLGEIEKWPIYLTNWDLLFGLTQSLLGLILVQKRWKSQKNPDFDANNLKYGRIEKLYWFLFVVTTSAAIGVTVTYWTLVHDPEIHFVDPLNIMSHVCNSILMLLDICITSIPFELRFYWWCALLVIFYLCFSVVYYLAGGLDKHGHRFIYKVLDWEKPGRALIVCTGGLLFVMFVHCSMYYLVRFRDRLYERKCIKTEFSTSQQPVKSNNTDLPIV